MAFEQAVYHLGYEVNGEQPVISVHTDPAHLADLVDTRDDLTGLQNRLKMESDFGFDSEAFGYAGTGRIVESPRVAGWVAMKLAIPESEVDIDDRWLGESTGRLLPVTATLSVALKHLRQIGEGDPVAIASTDPKYPQLVIAGLSNLAPLDQPCSAPLRAHLTPAMLNRLSLTQDIEAAEETVRQALLTSFRYPYGYVRSDKFRVSLDEVVSFDYPGDGTGFYGSLNIGTETKGLNLIAANNDHPLQQIAIMGGLAALTDVALEH